MSTYLTKPTILKVLVDNKNNQRFWGEGLVGYSAISACPGCNKGMFQMAVCDIYGHLLDIY